ncbi:MAG: hypothetical protein QOD00_1363, partial [Blastocatellia bacterium]|nr:hypothetical protein [Blastocatellia bacterium]
MRFTTADTEHTEEAQSGLNNSV